MKNNKGLGWLMVDDVAGENFGGSATKTNGIRG